VKVAALVWFDARASGGALEFMGRPVLETVVDRLKGVNGIERVIFCPDDSYEGPFPDSTEILRREGRPETEVIKRIFADSGADHIVKVFADSPFLDTVVIQEMLDVHLSCLPEYTYSENLPQGFTAEIISGEIVDSLPDDIAVGVTLNEVVRAHLHQFDVEIFYRDPDVRDSRMSFRSSSKRDRRVMENMVARHGGVPSYSEIRGIIKSSPELLYVGPSYLEIELTGRCSLDCVFCYRNTLKHEHPDMDPAVLESALLGMREFDLPFQCVSGVLASR
jgi:spiro-SPASM protein